jgi:putative intracellular protease/amidase
VVDAGGTAEVVAIRPGMVETMRHLDRADRVPVDRVTEQVQAADYDAAVLPGGVANPDQLRRDAAAVDFLMAVDREVVVCRQGINTLVTSRQPEDLRAFCREFTAACAPVSLAV